MALRNIFKKKKKTEGKAKPREEIKAKAEKSSEAVRPKVKKETKAGFSWRILKPPHITEKAADLAKKNQYVFKISETANKTETKKAIENLYGVDVLAVRIVKISKKLRKRGAQKGWKKGYKKAIVKIKEGQKIEVLPR